MTEGGWEFPDRNLLGDRRKANPARTSELKRLIKKNRFIMDSKSMLKISTGKKTGELERLLLSYSTEDLLKSFFILNLWLPNIASPIKIEYLYTVLESVQKNLPIENKIKSYKDFHEFCKKVIAVIPSFLMLEDYIPEPDWGDLRYYFRKELYKIFYGGDLSNPYDFYYSFEIIHESFEQEYLALIQRSPVTEMKFCLELQNYILSNLKQERTEEAINKIKPRDIEVPSENFWMDASMFIDQYKPDNYYSQDILVYYTKEFNEQTSAVSIDAFIENAYHGRNCKYFFVKKKDRYYPVMPRKWLTVIYDSWGTLLRDYYSDIVKKLNKTEPSVLIGSKLAKFILDRVHQDNVFPLAGSIKSDLQTAHDLIFTIVDAGDKIILIYVTPPVFNQNELFKHLEEIQAKLKESAGLLSQPPSRFGLIAEQKIVEFKSTKGDKTLEPMFLIALPSPLSDMQYSIAIPEGIKAEIMTLDQVVGIFDEIEKPTELCEFYDYLERERELARIIQLNSYLDRFASFKDSCGVLVPGAIEPDRIMLDFSWGSNFRFESLKDFWTLFPEDSFYGHPRSWTIPIERKTRTGFVLKSRKFFGYAYYQKIGKTSFYINAPAHQMCLDDGRINDTIMQSLFDAIEIYSSIIEKLRFTQSYNQVQVFFCPSSLALKESNLAHVKHLIPNTGLWNMDYGHKNLRTYGIRVVYNKEKVVNTLKEVRDRSIQIRLLVDVLEQINTLIPDSNFITVKQELEKEKNEKARFITFAIDKIASFPEGVRTVLPDEREYKLADKKIAKIALELDIQPGTYSAHDGQEKLNRLRNKMVQVLNDKIKIYNLNDAIPILLEKSNSLLHDSWHEETEIKASRYHEVDYERGKKSSEREKKVLHWYTVYKYLIEKFVQLQPLGETELNDRSLKELLAFVDQLLDIYVASDFINYELYPVNVDISRDYVVSISDEKNDIALMEKKYGEEQANLNLGIIGNKNDRVESSLPINEYLDELDYAFKKDFKFGFRNFVNVQKVLALWAVNATKEECTHYYANAEEIASICFKQIRGYDKSETNLILEFLTLKPDEILMIKDDPRLAEDVPIWEHYKRLMRFDIRPLIKINDQFCWGPHSINRTNHIWVNIASKHRLPSDFEAPTIKIILNKGHQNLRNALVEKIKEIALRYTNNVKRDVNLHKYDKSISDIGDCDVLVYLETKNILLNIESKIIDPPHANKDSGRMQRKIFGETKDDGTFKKGYLQKVEERDSYLKANGKDLIERLGWRVSISEPKVISAFVTKMGFWWTKNPPISTEVQFIEIRLLEDFIKNIQ